MTEPMTRVMPATRRRRSLLAAAALLAMASCAVALWAGGATEVVPLPGIPTPAAEVTWLVPALRLVADAAAVLTVGCLLGAAVLAPGDRIISAAGYRWVRVAGWTAAAWSLAALAALPVLLADFLGTPLSAVSLRGVTAFVLDIPQGRAYLLVAALAAVVALAARAVLTPTGARTLLVVALAATLPPAFTGHSAEDADHNLAVTGVALHVLGVVLWAGGVLALLLTRSLTGPERTAAVRRFSLLAPPLVLLVAASGVLAALTRLPALGQLLDSSYGVLVLVKVTALLALAAVGWWHRRVTLPALAADRSGPFLRLVGVEVLIFAATIGLAVALGRTPLPPPTDPAVGATGHVAVSVPGRP